MVASAYSDKKRSKERRNVRWFAFGCLGTIVLICGCFCLAAELLAPSEIECSAENSDEMVEKLSSASTEIRAAISKIIKSEARLPSADDLKMIELTTPCGTFRYRVDAYESTLSLGRYAAEGTYIWQASLGDPDGSWHWDH